MANDNKPNPNKIKVSPWLLYAGVIVLFLFISFATGGSNFQELAKTTSSKFNTYLERGDIQKVIVYNKSDFNWAAEQAAFVNERCKLLLQPEYGRFTEVMPLIVDYVKLYPQWQISIQTHKFINVP